MSNEVVLTSATAHLRIVLENENSSLTFSPDGSILYVEAPNDSFILSSALILKNGAGEEIWSASLASDGSSNKERIRVDSIFPLVFEKDEIFQVFPSLILTFDSNCCSKKNIRPVFELCVKVKLSSEAISAAVLVQTAAIHTEKLTVGETTIPVSKEFMILSSPFFDRLFNGNFCEKKSGVYEIKDVAAEELSWFMNSFHRSHWEFTSMYRALGALHMADRFEFLYLHSRIFPYLKNNRLPVEDVKDTLIVCARFKRIDDLILWVLDQCGSEKAALKTLHECASQLTPSSMEAVFSALLKISEREKIEQSKKDNERLQRIIKRVNIAGTRSALILACLHDANNKLESENLFSMALGNDLEFPWSGLWTKIPLHYTVLKIGAEMRQLGAGTPPGGSNFYKPGQSKFVIVNAFLQ